MRLLADEDEAGVSSPLSGSYDTVLVVGAYFAPFALSMAGIVCRII
jgi:hypothetical protein